MPELPEVETIVRRLQPLLAGQKIQRVQVFHPKILRLSSKVFIDRLTGAIIRKIRRKGKLIVMDLDPGLTLFLHLKMTGQLLFEPDSSFPDRHTHVIFHLFPSGFQLRYRDIRKFGFFDLEDATTSSQSPLLLNLGPDPFEITPGQLIGMMHSKKKTVKSLLLDQSAISGLGNIYADESLFRAKIHPLTGTGVLSKTRIQILHQTIREVLSQAIREKGSTLRDYRRPDGQPGGFQNFHQVYGRTGKPCPVCGSPIEKIRVAGRGTHLCPFCQKIG
jgi:formamidopyrimidine-DNA glycosylase